jgi:hypothetical protein
MSRDGKHPRRWPRADNEATEGTTRRPGKTTVNGTLLGFSFQAAPVKLGPCTTMTWL